jgi:FeS assembly SUF system regulator
MLRISKLTDYGVVLGTRLAQAPAAEIHAVSDLARETGIPEPTVRKVLKQLGRVGVVLSQRGARGGYRLARPAAAISVREIITALEGPIAVTECASDETQGACEYEGRCDVQGNWQRINAAVQGALDGISLADMAEATPDRLVTLGRPGGEERRRAETVQ